MSALFVGETYRGLAIDSQQLAFKEIIRLQVHQLIDELEHHSIDLGQSLQNPVSFRQSFKERNIEEIKRHLSSQYHQYFVTTGIIKLENLAVFDQDMKFVAGSAQNGVDEKEFENQVCGNLLSRALNRNGADRLKSISELCEINKRPYFSVLLPLGGLRVLGYVEVISDPVYTLSSLGSQLGMPLQLILSNGREVFRSKNWRSKDNDDNGLIADYQLNTDQGAKAIKIAIVHDVRKFQGDLSKTRNMVMIFTLLATLVLAAIMLLILNRTALGPLRLLSAQLRKIHNDDSHLGNTIAIEGNGEVRELAYGFNQMTQKLKELYDALRNSNRDLTAQITERVHAEQELKKHRDHLEELVQKRTGDLMLAMDEALEASKAKSLFLANMSHELRTPLNAIIGYSEILIEETEECCEQRLVTDLRTINTAGKHLLALINDILDLTKIEAGKIDIYLETFDISWVIHDVVTMVAPLIDKNNNQLTVCCQEDIGQMRADITKVRQALFNILSNAAKFTTGGNIRLEVNRTVEGEEDVVTFSVTDNGIGISQKQLDKLFQPFIQADLSTTRKYGGTGLGLVISRRFCQMMGGDIFVDSEPGRGSTFSISIPATVKEVSAQEVKPEVRLIDAKQTHVDPVKQRFNSNVPEDDQFFERRKRLSTVLVIDDDPAVLDLMARFLTKEGFNYQTASSGEEGISLARKIKPDVITLDVMMQTMDGWAVLNAIKQDPELKDVPVIMLTMLDNKKLGFTLGATEYLSKPINKENLLDTIKKCVRRDSNQPILIVDDDENIRSMARYSLEKAGWRVAEAVNGHHALTYVNQQTPSLILLDLMMPEMDGFQFVTELRKNDLWRRIPVIVMTAMELSSDDRRALQGEVEQIIQKGAYNIPDLLNELGDILPSMVRRTA